MKASEATKILEVLTAMSKTAEAIKGLKGPNEREGDDEEDEGEKAHKEFDEVRDEYLAARKKVDAVLTKRIASKVERSVKDLLNSIAAGEAPNVVILVANGNGFEAHTHIAGPFVGDMIRALESTKASLLKDSE